MAPVLAVRPCSSVNFDSFINHGKQRFFRLLMQWSDKDQIHNQVSRIVSCPTIGNAFRKRADRDRQRFVCKSSGCRALRDEGFERRVTIIGDEPGDRLFFPGRCSRDGHLQHTRLQRMRQVKADWRLCIAAISLDHCVLTTPGNPVRV
jgi:hypothetical protein